jgi:hypothetical protein
MLAPGDCSPSRNVVSKILIILLILSPLFSHEIAQNVLAARPQRAGRLRRTLRGTSQGGPRLRTRLEGIFSDLRKQKASVPRPGTEASKKSSVVPP